MSNIFNIFQTVKEVNDKLIRIEMENTQLKDKISTFSSSFIDIVEKLKQRNHELEMKHLKEIESLRSEMRTLKDRFDTVTQKALYDYVSRPGEKVAELNSKTHQKPKID